MTNTWDFRATKSATDCKWLGMSSSESESVRDPIQFHSEFCECLKGIKISICTTIDYATTAKSQFWCIFGLKNNFTLKFSHFQTIKIVQMQNFDLSKTVRLDITAV